MRQLLRAFEKAYRLEEAKKLLRPDWRALNVNAPHSTGFCYIGAEACFHLLGGKNAGLLSYYAAYEEDGMRCTHWWLKKKGRIIDPTASQYTELGLKPPYHLGKGAGFLTLKPSRRAYILMEMVLTFLPRSFQSNNVIYKDTANCQLTD
jgi:hypothetical protein